MKVSRFVSFAAALVLSAFQWITVAQTDFARARNVTLASVASWQ